MHILIPPLSRTEHQLDSDPKQNNENATNVPCTLERQHHERRAQRRVIDSSTLASAPLRQAKYLNEQDAEEDEQDQPQSQHAQNNRQTRSIRSFSHPFN